MKKGLWLALAVVSLLLSAGVVGTFARRRLVATPAVDAGAPVVSAPARARLPGSVTIPEVSKAAQHRIHCEAGEHLGVGMHTAQAAAIVTVSADGVVTVVRPSGDNDFVTRCFTRGLEKLEFEPHEHPSGEMAIGQTFTTSIVY